MRLEAWPERLAAFIESRRRRPFAWGEHDCVVFAADAVRELTGVDHLSEFRGRYATARAAAKLLRDVGQLDAAVTARLGPAVAPRAAQRGDVVLLDLSGASASHASAATDASEGAERMEPPGVGAALGICLGAVIAAPGPEGLQFLPLRRVQCAWHV